MRFICQEYGIDLRLEENRIQMLHIENQTAFSKITESLWKQSEGEEGIVTLFEEGSACKFDSVCRCIFTPFEADCNERKILNRVYAEICKNMLDQYQIDFLKLHESNQMFIEKLLTTVPYALSLEEESAISDLLKIYGVRFRDKFESVAEQVIEYIRTSHMVLGIEVFIFLNLEQFFTDEQFQNFYKFICYEKVQTLIISGGDCLNTKLTDNISKSSCILDKDLCIIKL